MPKHGDAAVRRFVILGELPLAGHADGTELDGASIGIEPLEILFGGKPANFIESILDRFFSLKHGAGQRHGDFDGDGIYGLASDLCGHGISSVKTPATTTLSGRRHRYLVDYPSILRIPRRKHSLFTEMCLHHFVRAPAAAM